jgi:hypothetical protein
MALPQKDEQFWQEFQTKSDSLNKTLAKLRPKIQTGLSSSFKEQAISAQEALEHCEKAMKRLAEDYINALISYQESPQASKSLQALKEAEVIWSAEASIIKHFDADLNETKFLFEMREQTLKVLESKLEETAKKCQTKPSEELAALMIGSLMTMDSIYGELGHPHYSPPRQGLRDLALALRPSYS